MHLTTLVCMADSLYTWEAVGCRCLLLAAYDVSYYRRRRCYYKHSLVPRPQGPPLPGLVVNWASR
jgi:hypothetical protein